MFAAKARPTHPGVGACSRSWPHRDAPLAILGLGVLLWGGHPAFARDFEVGTFVKAPGAAPATQVIPHLLAQRPHALVLWSEGHTSESLSNAPTQMAFGMCDGTTCRAISGATRDDPTTTQASRRSSADALCFVAPDQTVLAAAELVALEDTGFSLRWTLNDGQPYRIHYLLLSGANLRAQLTQWTLADAANPGPVTVSGLPFSPELLLTGASGESLTTVPSAMGGLNFKLSAAHRDKSQWVSGAAVRSAETENNSARWQEVGSLVLGGDYGVPIHHRGSLATMTEDGFTVVFAKPAGSPGVVFTLAVGGVRAHVGTFQKRTDPAPVQQRIGGLGFTPEVILLRSALEPSALPIRAGAGIGLGVATLEAQAFGGLSHPSGPAPIRQASVSSESHVFSQIDANLTGVNAQASLASVDADGFTLEWDVNDGTATEVGYVAMAPLTPSSDAAPTSSATPRRLQLACTSAGAKDISLLVWGLLWTFAACIPRKKVRRSSPRRSPDTPSAS